MLEDTVLGSLFDDTVLGRVRRLDIDVRTGVPLGRPGKLEHCSIEGLVYSTLKFTRCPYNGIRIEIFSDFYLILPARALDGALEISTGGGTRTGWGTRIISWSGFTLFRLSPCPTIILISVIMSPLKRREMWFILMVVTRN